jgi:hypothetical protein
MLAQHQYMFLAAMALEEVISVIFASSKWVDFVLHAFFKLLQVQIAEVYLTADAHVGVLHQFNVLYSINQIISKSQT